MSLATLNAKTSTKNKESHLSKLNSMSSYLRDIDKVSLLTRKEEELLTKQFGECCQPKIKQNARHEVCVMCARAKEQLISANLRFVVSVAKKYQGNNLSLADLINEGNLGLLSAVDKFDYTLGYHFISYAVWWIKQSIMKAISEKSRMIRLPMNRTNDLFKIAKFIDQYTKLHSQKPSEEEIESSLGINRYEIKRILDLANGHTSLEDILINDSGENSASTDISDDKYTPEQEMMNKSLSYSIEDLLKHVTDRERFILIHRFGLKGKESHSLSKIGEMLGLTKERVRQLEKQALDSMRVLAQEKNMVLYFS